MFLENKKLVISYIMNQIFLGQPSDAIKTWFTTEFPSWPTYTTLKFADGTTQTKEITGAATWQNIGIKRYPEASDTTLTYCQLGRNVTEISGLVFYYCMYLASISIPNSVTSIGYGAFDGCSALASISIPNSVTSIGNWAFSDCYSLTSITIPNSVSSIGSQLFMLCPSLTSIYIPDSVTLIGNSAFYQCQSLTSINIPNSVTSIGAGAFTKCSSLTSVIFEGKTSSEITSMTNYPWEIPNTSALKPGIS